MNEKTRYRIAGAIFSVLLIYPIYCVGRCIFALSCTDTESPYLIWMFNPDYDVFLCVLKLLFAIACACLFIVPLVVLAKSAFKEQTNQKTKIKHFLCFSIGLLVSSAFNFFNLFGLHIALIYVGLFAIALFGLMMRKSEINKAAEKQNLNAKINYYKEMLEQGVISQDEFNVMMSKIRNGEL